jgi:MFS family permease
VPEWEVCVSDGFSEIPGLPEARKEFYYGWVIVAVCSLSMAISYGIIYSFSVFFKPIAAQFNWERATVASIYSLAMIFRGAVTVPIGWLADRYGPATVFGFCGIMIAAGLVLTSRVTELWQFYTTYAIILPVGLCGAYTIGSAVTSRWFLRKRGMALGIVAAGSGFGTLLLVPLSQHLINVFSWSGAYVIIGIVAGCITIATAFLLKAAPPQEALSLKETGKSDDSRKSASSLRKMILSREMLLVITIFGLINFCIQMVMVHLVNFATDIGIPALQAAGYLGIIGVISIAGRLVMGGMTDRIGTYHSLVVCGVLLLASLTVLLFKASPLGFVIFAVLFGFAYGGEIPQLPMLIADIFGVRAMGSLMGIAIFISMFGAALGPWVGGKIYDLTRNYPYAFAIAAVAGMIRLSLIIGCKKLLVPRSTQSDDS